MPIRKWWRQDDDWPTPRGFDEDFWQQPPFPRDIPLPPRLFSDDDFIVPAAAPAVVDEHYWLQFVLDPWRPVPRIFSDDDSVPQLYFDEDYWQNQVPQSPQAFLFHQPWAFDDQIPALSAGAVFTPDEDYWQNWMQMTVQPMAIQIPFYLLDSGDIVPQPVAGTQNYINTGTNNYVSQRIGEGIEF